MSTVCSCSGYFMAWSNETQEIGSVATALTFNTTTVIDLGEYTHTTASGIVQVKSNGFYEIGYGINFEKVGMTAGACEVLAEVYKNNAKLEASQQFAVINSAGHPNVGIGAETITHLTEDDQLTLKAGKITNIGSTVNTMPSGVWFKLIKLSDD